MLEALTGAGLAAAAGMNAYIPLLVVGLADRLFPGLLALPESWAWLSSWWVIGIVAVLLVVEVVADKVPAVDSVNDVLQTLVRPAAGGLVFGSSSTASTVAVTDPAEFFASNQWVPIVVGAVIALAVHAGKATVRPAANAATAGAAAPVVSTVEDVSAIGLSLVAIVAPILVILGLLVLALLAWWLRRTARRRRRADLRPATERAADG
ncbi:DUF4126 domain-containing protein [Agrococcus sp. TF02-05]|uniref:DUF4126 domain-containing protein n=1 Tax=Agrococcus sp. TF02-05 TaxID=2815211 RepID=UPI001AA1047B|nr:DUF4126 domain-containing protein [Agrococcus sp. TF02-05]MBO1768783.1 DUF4126 domain-containing protein [Agrococcus sp. TF02-05]